MILKNLRQRKALSQEQLAMMSGLNVRTIQRIEQGKKASVESLKSIASVLGTSISELEQDIMLIDKTTDKWKSLPLIFRLNFIGSEIGWLGLSRRDHWVKGEKQTAIFGMSLLPFGLLDQAFIPAGLLIICIAYIFALITRAGDQYSVW